MKVLDLCVIGDDNVHQVSPASMFEYSQPRSWSGYIADVNDGNLDGEYFELQDVDKRVFIIDDGGELFRLKDGSYWNVCWRGDTCRVWEEDDPDRIAHFNAKLGL